MEALVYYTWHQDKSEKIAFANLDEFLIWVKSQDEEIIIKAPKHENEPWKLEIYDNYRE